MSAGIAMTFSSSYKKPYRKQSFVTNQIVTNLGYKEIVTISFPHKKIYVKKQNKPENTIIFSGSKYWVSEWVSE